MPFCPVRLTCTEPADRAMAQRLASPGLGKRNYKYLYLYANIGAVSHLLSWQVLVEESTSRKSSYCRAITIRLHRNGRAILQSSRHGEANRQIFSIESKVSYAVQSISWLRSFASLSAMTVSAKCAVLRLAQEAEERPFLCNMKPGQPVPSLTDGFAMT